MLIPGRQYPLVCADRLPQGMYLEDEEGDRVLLPNREIPEGAVPGDPIKAFLYLDSDDRLIATTKPPIVQLDQVAWLKVADVNNTGAFLDWGLPKDLFVPFAEQPKRMETGHSYLVYLTQDNTGRLIGSARLNRHIQDQIPDAVTPNYRNGTEVSLYIGQSTDLGYKVVVNHQYWGLLHANDVRSAVTYGQRMKGYVKRLRDDNRLDISLEPVGHRKTDALSKRILAKLERSNGFLAITDKSPSDLIEIHFACSKRAYKAAIGRLLTEGKVQLIQTGVQLTSAASESASKHSAKPDAMMPPASRSRSAKTDQTPPANSGIWKRSPKKNLPEDESADQVSGLEEKAQKKPKRIWKSNRKPKDSTLSLKK
jgi:predicted RNA-binding protein (virulence factor B family)